MKIQKMKLSIPRTALARDVATTALWLPVVMMMLWLSSSLTAHIARPALRDLILILGPMVLMIGSVFFVAILRRTFAISATTSIPGPTEREIYRNALVEELVAEAECQKPRNVKFSMTVADDYVFEIQRLLDLKIEHYVIAIDNLELVSFEDVSEAYSKGGAIRVSPGNSRLAQAGKLLAKLPDQIFQTRVPCLM